MRLAAMYIGLSLVLPVVALAGNGEVPTCDRCLDIDATLFPTPAVQTIAGSTVGTLNSEYTYQFCAVANGTYVFTTCEDDGGSSTYDSALSVWTVSAGACGASQVCNDDDCGPVGNGLHSYLTFTNGPTETSYLIVVDGFSTATGSYVLAYSGPTCQVVPVSSETWGMIKATYR